MSVATSESWKDKQSGDWHERTEWHRVVVWSPVLVKRIEEQVTTGTPVIVEGKLETRMWEHDGQKKYVTEIVVRPYVGDLIVLNRRSIEPKADTAPEDFTPAPSAADYFQGAAVPVNELEDEIPF